MYRKNYDADRFLLDHGIDPKPLMRSVVSMFEKYYSVHDIDPLMISKNNVVEFAPQPPMTLEEAERFLDQENIDATGAVNSVVILLMEHDLVSDASDNHSNFGGFIIDKIKWMAGLCEYKSRSVAYKTQKHKKSIGHFVRSS